MSTVQILLEYKLYVFSQYFPRDSPGHWSVQSGQKQIIVAYLTDNPQRDRKMPMTHCNDPRQLHKQKQTTGKGVAVRALPTAPARGLIPIWYCIDPCGNWMILSTSAPLALSSVEFLLNFYKHKNCPLVCRIIVNFFCIYLGQPCEIFNVLYGT